jgi:hypothetical protein
MNDNKKRLMAIAEKAMAKDSAPPPEEGPPAADAPPAEGGDTKEWTDENGFMYQKTGDVITVTHPETGKSVQVEKDGQNGQYFDVIMAKYDSMGDQGEDAPPADAPSAEAPPADGPSDAG